jgi:periplasmic protein CpxP/Spy
MKLRSGVLAVVLSVMMAGSVAMAQGPARMHGGGAFDGNLLGTVGDYLDLTDAQRTQIKQIMTKDKSTMGPLWQQERQSHQAMKELIMSGSFDEAKAQSIAQQAAQVQSQLMVEHARTASQAYAVLTAEQKTKLAQFMAKHEQRIAEHKQQRANSDSTPNQ